MPLKRNNPAAYMKYFYAILCLLAVTQTASAQTLFTYGPHAVDKAEFLRAYNKNKTAVTDQAAAYREYLNLYANFKLKVKAAQTLKLDTLEQLKYDLQNFRSQVEEGYLTDEATVNRMLDEAFERSQRDIHLLHFYVPISNKANPADTVKAHKAMEEVRDELLKGKTDYDALVDEISEEITQIKGKDLGFITAFTVPYDIETLAYGLPKGGISKVYRTKSALHVFKNAEERLSAGRWKVAQILLAIPPDVTHPQLQRLEKLADSLYNELKRGADFTKLAKQYSDDRITYLNGGEMAEFGTGKFELPFEKAVFALEKDGDFTQPIYTGYGFHIVKRLRRTPTPTDKNDETFRATLRQQLQQDTRMNIAREQFLKMAAAKTGFKRNPLLKDEQLFRYADSVVARKQVDVWPISNQVLFSFRKSTVKGGDWLQFVRDYKLNQDVYKGEDNKALLEKYRQTVTMEYYRHHLEEYNDDFRFQLQEFREGNMLFEIMERRVWSKAANDTEGLRKHYQAHQSRYTWPSSAAVILFSCSNEEAAKEALVALRAGKSWRSIMEESDGRVQADSGRYETEQLQIPAGAALQPGLITQPQVNATDNTASFLQVLQLFPAGGQRSFEEARGLVINEYQAELEEQWIAELRKQYPVKVNEAVFQGLLK